MPYIILYESVVFILVLSLCVEGGGVEFSLRFITFPLHGLSCVFTVMSNYSLDDLGFESPSVPSDVPP